MVFVTPSPFSEEFYELADILYEQETDDRITEEEKQKDD